MNSDKTETNLGNLIFWFNNQTVCVLGPSFQSSHREKKTMKRSRNCHLDLEKFLVKNKKLTLKWSLILSFKSCISFPSLAPSSFQNSDLNFKNQQTAYISASRISYRYRSSGQRLLVGHCTHSKCGELSIQRLHPYSGIHHPSLYAALILLVLLKNIWKI